MKDFLIASFSVTLLPKIIKINLCMSKLQQDKFVTFLRHNAVPFPN